MDKYDKYTGKRLDGRYEIQELIGVGGMATVYRAYDNVDDRTVALKILKDEFVGNEEFIRRFKNESKAIAVLSHPNIVKVYDISLGDRIQYIVMEYIDGITLKEYISHQHEIPWKEAVHFTVQILQALQHAHEKGIVHRDVKPQNIMLLQDGTIKVTDFGIARFSNTETRTMTDKAIGSVHYIAPEQARGDITDGKADIYSVGVMLYEMLTGKLPFEADSAVSVAIMQLQSEPKPLRDINENIPEGLEEITLKAMRKDPKQRYYSAKEMLEAIETFRHNPSVRFQYNYFVDETPTKHIDSLEEVVSSPAEQSYDDEYYSSPDEIIKSTRSKTIVTWVTIAVAVLFVVTIGVFIWMAVSGMIESTSAQTVDVPQFVGQMYEDIQSDGSYKFEFEISTQYDDTQPVGIILSQDPEAGSKQVKEDSVIKLVINSTSTTTTVPKVKNYTEEEAVQKLAEKYFTYEVATVNSTEVAEGYVISCSPQEGTEQSIGTKITLIVSAGAAAETKEVPNVIGQDYETAKATLESAGFTTQQTTVASDVEEGYVVSTDPLYGNYLTEGTLITIQVSDGSLISNSLTQEIALPTDEYAEITVAIYVDGKKVDESSGSPALGFSKTLELDPSGANSNNQNIVNVLVDGIRYVSYTFDFEEETVTQTYINEDYQIKQDENGEVSYDESSDDESSDDESSDQESSDINHSSSESSTASSQYSSNYESSDEESYDESSIDEESSTDDEAAQPSY